MQLTGDSVKNGDATMDAICERYRRLYAALIYDVLEHLGYPSQALSHQLTPLDRDMKLAGPAFTPTRFTTRLSIPPPLFALCEPVSALVTRLYRNHMHFAAFANRNCTVQGCEAQHYPWADVGCFADQAKPFS